MDQCSSKCLGLIFIVTQVAAVATSCSSFFWGTSVWLPLLSPPGSIDSKFAFHISAGCCWDVATGNFSSHQVSPFGHPGKDKNQGAWPFKRSLDFFFFFGHVFSSSTWIWLFKKYLLHSYSSPGTDLDTRDKAVNKRDKNRRKDCISLWQRMTWKKSDPWLLCPSSTKRLPKWSSIQSR